MIKKILKQLTAWSFSRWKDYTRCPAYAKYKHLEKRKEPDHPAGARGTAVHEKADGYVSGRLRAMPVDFKKFRKKFEELKKAKALGEQEWAFDAQWNKVDWFDMPRAWLRVKADAHYLTEEKVKVRTTRTAGQTNVTETTVRIVDFKTGKMHEDDHAMQRELYAIGAMLVYPDVVCAVVEHWYLDTGETRSSTFQVAELPRLQKLWKQRSAALLADKLFAPRPGSYCRFCHFRKGNGGPCRF